MQLLIDTVGINQTGNTEYEQLQTVGILSGDPYLLAGHRHLEFLQGLREFAIQGAHPLRIGLAKTATGSTAARRRSSSRKIRRRPAT